MESEILDATRIGAQLTELTLPYIAALLVLVIALMFKDYATQVAKGVSFKMNRNFAEGDKVILDGEKALIVKIGLTETVFGVTKAGGEFDGDYVWRYVPNERIQFLKIEKIIFDKTPEKNGKKHELNRELIMDNRAIIESLLEAAAKEK